MAVDSLDQYEEHISNARSTEYPNLAGNTYLDHAGATPFAKSVIEIFSNEMMMKLYGNPHSASHSSQLATRKIEDVRLKVLQLFRADPSEFDLIFVANATAGIKLVMEAFRAHESGFWYGFHKDAHTSLVGVREAARAGHKCFQSSREVEEWLTAASGDNSGLLKLFAYPAQSNMNGRRLPLDWAYRTRQFNSPNTLTTYSLLDAAALTPTSPLDFSDDSKAPDFTVLSFCKMFGFPDLGGLIVRKDSGKVLQNRQYFGGGTVDMVVCGKEHWHAKKSETFHDALEDGTLPVHSIMALGTAMQVHNEIFGTFSQISKHTSRLASILYEGLNSMRHGNDTNVCKVYKDCASSYNDAATQGPVVAFNMRTSRGAWISNSEFEKLAVIKNFHLRTGGLCNPGGIAEALDLEPWEMKENFSAGQRCGSENDIINGKPTGMIRVSLGAISTRKDVNAFLDFIKEFFVDEEPELPTMPLQESMQSLPVASFFVESLTVYPIKSCAGWMVPCESKWQVHSEGLAWDREWCLVHPGTMVSLSQKQHPRMALIRPIIDLITGKLRVRFEGYRANPASCPMEISVPLSADPSYFDEGHQASSKVCGDNVRAKVYKADEISDFFTTALGVPCQLARFPAGGTALHTRHVKDHLHTHLVPRVSADSKENFTQLPLLLSNESPILTINRSSLNRLNEEIKANGGKAAQAEVFRANIVIAQDRSLSLGSEQPYVEDSWRLLQIGKQYFQLLGPCRRCQMVCVDQRTAEKNENPFVTLAKTRRVGGKVFFGQHTAHLLGMGQDGSAAQNPTVQVGDPVTPYMAGMEADELFCQVASR